MKRELNIGIVGAGNFAFFASTAFLKLEGLHIIGVTDTDILTAGKLAEQVDAKVYNSLESLLENKSIDLVYIATPPYLHFNQSKKALLSGKHVICEKPAALHTTEAMELQTLARSLNLLYVVNLMQRYNPLYGVVKNIIDKKILGNFLHGFFENYAGDENLLHDHWFWNPLKSGGIFIEHGVHFFDMFSGWLGEGEAANAICMHRKRMNNKTYDRVQATMIYKEGPVNFYHGFDQPGILDRQEIRLLFERGEISLYEWIPVRMKIHGLFDQSSFETLQAIISNDSIVYHSHNSQNKKVNGRATEINFNDHITLTYNGAEKQERYQDVLTAMMDDQWSWIKDRSHVRVIDDTNAVESLRSAEKATAIAQEY